MGRLTDGMVSRWDRYRWYRTQMYSRCTVDVIVDVLAVITNIYKLSLGKYKKCFLFSNKLYVHGTVRVHSVHCTV